MEDALIKTAMRDGAKTREEAREVVKRAVLSEELDISASFPSSEEFLSSFIDKELKAQIELISEENEKLRRVTRMDPEGTYKIESMGLVVTPEEARGLINENTKTLLNIKKGLSESIKSKQTSSADNNIQINLGEVFSNALSNIKEAEVVQ